LIEPSEQEGPLAADSAVGEASAAERAEKQEEELRAFFREKLLPLAERGRERGFRFLPEIADGQTGYVAYPSDTPELVDGDTAINEQALRELWERQGFPELADLAGPIMEWRAKLKPAADETEGEVSPFIYAMF